MISRTRKIVAIIACAVLILGVVGVVCVLHQPNTKPSESDSEITVYTESVSDMPDSEITEPENTDQTEPSSEDTVTDFDDSSEESATIDEDSEWTTPIESDTDGEESKSPDTLEETETTEPDTEEPNTEEPNTEEPNTDEPETDASEPSRDSCLDGGEHSYTSSIIQATCMEEGKSIFTCSVCGYSYVSDLVYALGHTWSEWNATVTPSCFSDGIIERTCASCSATESKNIEKYTHQYELVMSEDTATSGSQSVYRCELCRDTYTLNEGETLPIEATEQYVLPSCDQDFSFYILSEGDSDYIYKNLTITDAYKSATGESATRMRGNVAVDAGELHFTVTPVADVSNKWLVTVEGGYEEYGTYVVIPNGDISFADYNTESLVICVDGADCSDIRFNLDNILFLKKMEERSPGYYPYSVHFDENAEKYYVTLSKKGDFDDSCIGKVLCVGDISDESQLLTQTNEDMYFGKIASVWNSNEGLTVVELVQPELGDVYDSIKYSGTGVADFSAIEDQLAEQMQDEFIQSETFARFVAAANLAATEYTRANGLDVHAMSEKSIWDNLEFKHDLVEEENGFYTYITVMLPVDLKIKGDKVGSVVVECTVKLDVDFEIRHNIITVTENGESVDFSQFSINIVNTNTLSYDLSCKIEMEYETNTPDFCVNADTGKIHSPECRYVQNSSVTTPYHTYTTKQLLHTYQVDSVDKLAYKECKACKPISGLVGSLFIASGNTKMVHCANCVHVANIEKAEYWLVLPFAGEYSYCTDCKPEKAQHAEFHDCLMNAVNSEDLSSIMNEVKECTSGLANKSDKAPGRKLISIPFNFPVITLMIDVEFVLDFDFEASLQYHAERTFVNDVYIRRVGNKIECGNNQSQDKDPQIEETLDVMGELEFKVGIRLGIGLTFNGPFSKWCYVGVSVEAGIYANVRGVLHATRTDGNMNDDYYFGIYFESGIYVSTYFDYVLFVFENSINLSSVKLPMWIGGNDRIYYQYSEYDRTVQITQDKTNLDSLNLLKVDYLLLNEDFTKESGKLSAKGDSLRYTVSYAFHNTDGSINKYCTVKNGVLKIDDSAPEDFTVIMTVTVTGKQYDSFQNFVSMLSTAGNRTPAFFLEPYEVTLVINRDTTTGDGGDGSEDGGEPGGDDETTSVGSVGLAFRSNGNGTCYVKGIGSCTDRDIVIPRTSPDGDRVTGIGSYAFDCSNLTSITIPDSVTWIGEYAFERCYSLKCVTIGNGVTRIDKYAFYGCYCLTSITIPDSIRIIGGYAFYDCDSITSSITIPDSVTSIGDYAFYRCSGLASITIPDGVKRLVDYAFYGCSGLTSITIPESVTNIGNYAFYNCSSLTSITIPESVTSIGECALSGCSSLTSITVSEGNAVYHSADNCLIRTASKTLIAGCHNSVVPSDGSVMCIGGYAFSGCSSLTSITIPASVTSIDDYAFYNCIKLIQIENGVSYVDKWVIDCTTDVIQVTLRDDTVGIGDSAFEDCSNLTSIIIPENVMTISNSAFNNCIKLIQIENGVSYVDKWVIDCKTDATQVTLRDGAVGIGNYAFYNCSNLASITIPDSVTSIGHYAFGGCNSLTNITIPESVTNIGHYAFYNCISLTSITIPKGVTSIGDSAFSYCSSLTSITIPESVTSIGDWAFYGCSSLTNITIPEGVTSIDDCAFAGCSSLTNITIPDSVTSIGSDAFYWCSSLTSITIPDSVTSIGRYAFHYCRNLTSITISNSVTSIGDCAFDRCSSLAEVYYGGTEAEWKAITIGFYNDPLLNATIHCTDGDILP